MWRVCRLHSGAPALRLRFLIKPEKSKKDRNKTIIWSNNYRYNSMVECLCRNGHMVGWPLATRQISRPPSAFSS